MRKSTIIRFLRGNIEKSGSLWGGRRGCIFCREAEAKLLFRDVRDVCQVCPLWDYAPKPEFEHYGAECFNLKYKGEKLVVLDSRLTGNKPALRAMLNGLINEYKNKGGRHK